MGLLSSFFGKKKPAQPLSLSFPQAEHFRGFKKYKIASYGFDDAEHNLDALKTVKLKGNMITLKLIKCKNNSDAFLVYVDDLVIGTIFFSNGNYPELLNGFRTNQICGLYVKLVTFDDVPNYRPDAYLLVKYGG